ncbi:MAG TPA: cell division protein FtsA [bacterium]|nr:cell division protein FtsA [bacterium]
MREGNIAVGIDVGSTKIVTTVGAIDGEKIDIIGVGKSHNQGIRKGVIVDIEETVSAVSASVEEAERMSGYSVQSAVIGINGPHIECERSKGVIAVSRQDSEISSEDINRVIEAARAIPSKPNREVLHVLPQNYIIDGSEIIKDPIGMTGIRLEVEANIVTASTNATRALVRALEQAGIQTAELVFSPFAAAKGLLSKRQMDIGVMLVDIGANTTSYAVYEEGELVTCGVFPIGSMHITNDIAIGLRTNLDLAEAIKLKYGYALPSKVTEKEEIDLSKLDKREEESVNLRYVAEIVEARLNEIFMLIRDSLVRLDCNTALPAGIILTGGGSKIDGIIEMTKDTMRLPAQIGAPIQEISGLIDKLNDPIYATSIGLMLWSKNHKISTSSFNLEVPGVDSLVQKIRSVFKNFMP